MIVVDASAAIEMLLGMPAAARVRARLLEGAESLHAPHLIDLEVAQVLRRLNASGIATADRCRTALEDLADLPLVRHRHDVFLAKVWDLRHNLTAYDAVYVALAEALGAPLVTCDAKMAAAPGHGVRVEVL